MRKLILLFLIPIGLLAQVNVSVDTTQILIGSQITFNLEANLDNKQDFPQLTDSLGPFEIVSKSNLDSIKTDIGWQINQSFLLTAWDSGFYHIPALKIGPYTTDSIGVVVSTIELTENAQLKDIKPPIHTPISLEEIAPYLLGLIILVLILYLLRRFLKNRKKSPTIPTVVEKIIPPFEIALNKLEQLNAKKLWQSGDVKAYYSELSEVIRTYIEDGIGTPAMEIPTQDILFQLQQKRIDTTKLKEVLTRADLAKFAKAKPLDIENEESLKIGYDFIHQTKPQKQTVDDVE